MGCDEPRLVWTSRTTTKDLGLRSSVLLDNLGARKAPRASGGTGRLRAGQSVTRRASHQGPGNVFAIWMLVVALGRLARVGSVCVLVVLFLRTPSRAPYRTPSACANRAAYPDPPPVVPHPESIDAQCVLVVYF